MHTIFECHGPKLDDVRGDDFPQKLETILPETRNMTNADCLALLMGDGRRGVCVTARPPRPRPSYAVAPSVSLEDEGEGGAGRTPESQGCDGGASGAAAAG